MVMTGLNEKIEALYDELDAAIEASAVGLAHKVWVDGARQYLASSRNALELHVKYNADRIEMATADAQRTAQAAENARVMKEHNENLAAQRREWDAAE